MDTPTAATANQQSAQPCSREWGNFIVTAMFIFLGTGNLVDQEWIEGAGWLILAAGQFILMASPTLTNDNWKEPRYLACLLLCVVGISLVLNAPSHHKKHENASADAKVIPAVGSH